MKLWKLIVFVAFINSFCQKQDKPGDDFKFSKPEPKTITSMPSTAVDLKSKGIGPITEIKISPEIDPILVEKGALVFEQKCLACHKLEERFMGPALLGVTKRRSPEWIMNMMLNPSQMVNEDSLAMALFIEFDGLPMNNMGLTAAEARQVLEYFRNSDR